MAFSRNFTFIIRYSRFIQVLCKSLAFIKQSLGTLMVQWIVASHNIFKILFGGQKVGWPSFTNIWFYVANPLLTLILRQESANAIGCSVSSYEAACLWDYVKFDKWFGEPHKFLSSYFLTFLRKCLNFDQKKSCDPWYFHFRSRKEFSFSREKRRHAAPHLLQPRTGTFVFRSTRACFSVPHESCQSF